MNSTEQPAIGHNRPPEPLEELRRSLRESHTELIDRSDELLGLAHRLPPAEQMNDDWAERIAEAVKSCTMFGKQCEAIRLDANKPHRAAIAATDAFFKGMSEPVGVLKTRILRDLLTPWQKRRAAETIAAAKLRTDLGAVASLKTTYGFHVVDPAKVPRKYLSVNEQAIRAAIVAATNGGLCDLEIDGIEIFPITNTVVR